MRDITHKIIEEDEEESSNRFERSRARMINKIEGA
jgi:hypothetical protein